MGPGVGIGVAPPIGEWMTWARTVNIWAANCTKYSCAPNITESDFLSMRAGESPESDLIGFKYYHLLLQIKKTICKEVARFL